MALPDKIAKSSWLLTLASIAVVIGALYLAKGVLVPLTTAVLLSFLLSPMCDWLERRRLGRVPAVLVTALLGFTLLGALVWTAAVQISHLSPKIPEYRGNLETRLSSINEYAVAALSKVTRTTKGLGQNLPPSEQTDDPHGTSESPFSVRVLASPASSLQVFGGMFGTLLEVLGTTGIVIVLVVFFLIQREDLRDRFIHLIGKGHVTVTTQTLEDAGKRVSRYLSMLFLVNLFFGVSVGVGLYLIGIPNAILWGILAMTLRFIPYIGPWIAAAMPIGLSLAISTGWVAPCLTFGLFAVLEFLNNHVWEPWLYGKTTGVSAVAVLMAAIIWLWLWGPVGLLLATPLTVCLLVVGKHVPQLSFLHILLGTEPVFEPPTRIYQRLLAGDQEEAADLFENELELRPPVEVYDSLLIPALALAEWHSQLGELKEGKHNFILQSLKEIIQDRGERQQQERAKEDTEDALDVDGDFSRVLGSDSSPLGILCLPARTEADEITSLMLAQVLETKGRLVQALSVAALGGKDVDLIEQCTADVICVSATPPAAVMHARYLCKRLRGRHPEVKLVVGLWKAPGDLDKAKDRIGCGAIVVTTLAEAKEQIRLLAQPPDTRSEKRELPDCGPLVLAGAYP